MHQERKKGKVRDSERKDEGGNGEEKQKRYERYYHLYRQGELEEDVRSVGGEVVESGYERDNWWVIARRKNIG